jgi:hypothetical protein
MRFFRNLITNLRSTRRYAQVHDVRVEYSRYPAKDILEKESSDDAMSQSFNGMSTLSFTLPVHSLALMLGIETIALYKNPNPAYLHSKFPHNQSN